MAWYDDHKKLTQVVTYKNDKEASREAEKAAQKGWTPQGTSATDGHVNVGRTAGKILLLGLPFLVTGASRSKGKITLTYVRTPEWVAKHPTG
jgi:hypothetical protein